MEKTTKFLGYRVEESTFKLRPIKENEKFAISPRYFCAIKAAADRFTATLTVEIGESVSPAPAPFDLKATITGTFLIGEDVGTEKEKHLKAAVSALFPYLRAFVSTLTSASGVPPFILPFINGDMMTAGLNSNAPTTVFN
ncbi:MAG: protein-export chaperone SecB [Clostridia bacterium]|nr:protein-export chaperone SecB [Clostridia bacterium]